MATKKADATIHAASPKVDKERFGNHALVDDAFYVIICSGWWCNGVKAYILDRLWAPQGCTKCNKRHC